MRAVHGRIIILARSSSMHYATGINLLFWLYTGLEPAVFAALVPNSADKPLEELIEEIMGDHEMLVS